MESTWEKKFTRLTHLSHTPTCRPPLHPDLPLQPPTGFNGQEKVERAQGHHFSRHSWGSQDKRHQELPPVFLICNAGLRHLLWGPLPICLPCPGILHEQVCLHKPAVKLPHRSDLPGVLPSCTSPWQGHRLHCVISSRNGELILYLRLPGSFCPG